jgi:phage terminase large subunit-like protein
MDQVFANKARYPDDIQVSYIEAQGGFKILGSLLEEEQRKRGIWANVRPYPALGDKDARIRGNLQPYLEDKKLYVAESDMELIMEELRAFPQSYKKDILDAMGSAIAQSTPPSTPTEIYQQSAHAALVQAYRGDNVAGY